MPSSGKIEWARRKFHANLEHYLKEHPNNTARELGVLVAQVSEWREPILKQRFIDHPKYRFMQRSDAGKRLGVSGNTIAKWSVGLDIKTAPDWLMEKLANDPDFDNGMGYSRKSINYLARKHRVRVCNIRDAMYRFGIQPGRGMTYGIPQEGSVREFGKLLASWGRTLAMHHHIAKLEQRAKWAYLNH
jgi:hypothetical protein